MKDHRILIIIIINSLGILIIFICSILYLVFSSFSTTFVDQLTENFQSSPLFTLNTSSCSNALELGYWGGTEAGCNCLGKTDSHISYSRRNKINKGLCSDNETSYGGCGNIIGISKVSLQIYEGIRFCFNEDSSIVKHGYKYYLDNSVPFKSKCKEGYKQCGLLDTLNQKLCLKENETCPINDFYIDKNETSNPEYEDIPLKNNKYLHYTNSRINNSILIKLKLSENNEPCIYPGEYSWNYHYELEPSSSRCNTTILNSTVDYRYKLIDSTNKYEIYKDNGVINKTNRLPEYNSLITENENLNLYNRTYLGFEKQCLIDNDFSFENFDSILDKISTSKKCVIINLIVAGVIIFGFFSLSVKDSDDECVKCVLCLGFFYYWLMDSLDRTILFLNIFILFIDLILYILNLIALVSLMTIKIKFECGDEVTNALISDMKKAIGKNTLFSIIMLITSIIGICSVLCIAIHEAGKKLYAHFHMTPQSNGEIFLNQNSTNTSRNINSEMNSGFTSNNQAMLGNNVQLTPQNNNNLTPNDNQGFTSNIPYNNNGYNSGEVSNNFSNNLNNYNQNNPDNYGYNSGNVEPKT